MGKGGCQGATGGGGQQVVACRCVSMLWFGGSKDGIISLLPSGRRYDVDGCLFEEEYNRYSLRAMLDIQGHEN